MSLSDILQLEEKKAQAYDPKSGERAFGESFNKAVFGEIDRRRKLKETEGKQEHEITKLEMILGERTARLGQKDEKGGGGKGAGGKAPDEFKRLSTLYTNRSKELAESKKRLFDPISKRELTSIEISKMSESQDPAVYKKSIMLNKFLGDSFRLEKERDMYSELMDKFVNKNPKYREAFNKVISGKTQPDEFGFTLGQEEKGYKYIGKNQWQLLK